MKTVSVVTQKGGSGKSTLAVHLAVAASHGGAGRVGLIDRDPQGTLREWHAARTEDDILLGPPPDTDLKRALASLRDEGIDIAVVDTPPSSLAAIEAVVRLSDLVLVPVRPSPNDIRAIGDTARLIETLGKPSVFVINGATRGAQITAQAIAPISRFGPLAPVIIHNRVTFASSMIDGHAAMEVSGGEAAGEEVARLWAYVESRLAAAERVTTVELAV